MPAPTLRQVAEAFPKAADAESLLPWLLNLDADENGRLDGLELKNTRGELRCDFRVSGMETSDWKKLEKVLVGQSWVLKSSEACRPGGNPGSPDRLPTASAGLFRAADHDMVFQLGKGVDLSSILDFLRDAGLQPQQGKKFYDTALPSGAMLRLEVSPAGNLQKLHYLGDQGQPSWLCRLEFWEMLRSTGRFESFFAVNPYHAQEREVWGRFHSVVTTFRKTPTLSLKDLEKKSWREVLLFPDFHGNWKRFRKMEKLVREEKLDWIALEMLPHSLQPELDEFLSAATTSAAWKDAKRKLQNHLQPFWASYFKKMQDPDGNPYYQLLLLCRQRKIKVHALDARITYTLSSGRKSSPLNIGTRNKIWAEYIPTSGKGIVYGGAFHFTGYAKVRVQDFLWEKNSKRKIHLLELESQ